MAKSNKTTSALLREYVGQAGNYGSSGNRYMRLWTVLPGNDGTGGVEVSGGSYAATECSGDFPTVAATDRSIANDSAVAFPTATADWGDVIGYTIGDATTGTDFHVIVPLDGAVTVASGATATFAVGSIVLSEDD